MRYAVALLALFAMPAWAQDAPQLAEQAYCGAFIPSSALKDSHRGEATISYRVLADGSVADPTIKSSSGYGELDDAARSCVGTWLYRPATQEGQIVETMLTTKVPMATPRLHTCVLKGAAWDKVRPLKGVTRLQFTIDDTGHTVDISVAVSSGEAELDAVSKDCVSYWRYLPAVHDGKAASVPWEVDIAWNVDSRPERLTDMTKCVRDIRLKPEDMTAVQNPSAISYSVIGGTVFDLKLEKSSGNTRLDNLALRCASHTRFRETLVIGASPGFRAIENVNWKAELRPVP